MGAERGQAGFTLIEAVVALAILAIGLPVLMQLISSGFGASAAAERLAAETAIAQSELARIGVERPLEPGETAGEYGGGYRWRLAVREAAATPVTVLFEVSLSVWQEGKDAGITVSTLRLVPTAGQSGDGDSL